jgi:hypothetical protein
MCFLEIPLRLGGIAQDLPESSFVLKVETLEQSNGAAFGNHART